MMNEDKRNAVNNHAAEVLGSLLAEAEKAQEDESNLDQYEIEFLGDLYARMITSVFLGYFPNIMGQDAVEAAHRLNDIAKEHADE